MFNLFAPPTEEEVSVRQATHEKELIAQYGSVEAAFLLKTWMPYIEEVNERLAWSRLSPCSIPESVDIAKALENLVQKGKKEATIDIYRTLFQPTDNIAITVKVT